MSRGTACLGAANGRPHVCAPQAGGDFGTKIFVGGLCTSERSGLHLVFWRVSISTSRL